VASKHYRSKTALEKKRLAILLTTAKWNELTTACILQAWEKLVYQEDKSDRKNKDDNRNESKDDNIT
jgi:hypothetical protein